MIRFIENTAKTQKPFDGTGLYVSVMPEDRSVKELLDLMSRAVRRPTAADVDEWHCTLMYSKTVIKRDWQTLPPDTRISAQIKRFEWWLGHDGRGYLVATLDSPGMVKRNRYWSHYGKHTHTYTPHITVMTPVQESKTLYAKLVLLNRSLESNPVVLSFRNEIVEGLDVKD